MAISASIRLASIRSKRPTRSKCCRRRSTSRPTILGSFTAIPSRRGRAGWKSPESGGMAPACISDWALVLGHFGDMAGDGRCGASIGTVTASSLTVGPTSREARHFSIAITTIAARPVLRGPWRRTADSRAAMRRAARVRREFAPVPLADTTMAATQGIISSRGQGSIGRRLSWRRLPGRRFSRRRWRRGGGGRR